MNLTVLIFLAGCICNAAAQSVPGPLIMSSGSPVLQSFGNANVLVISFPAPPPPTAPPFTLPPTFSGMTLESLPRISTRPPIISPAITASPALPDSALLRRDMPAYALVDLTKAQGFRMERKPVRPDQIGVLVGQQEAKDARFL